MDNFSTVRFGPFELDRSRRLLLRDGTAVRLSPKAFLLLTALIERYPAAVAKGELHQAIWPDTFVSETTLAGLAVELRAALEDDARDPKLIRTVHGFGYAFVGDLAVPEARLERSRFRVTVLGRDIPLHKGENVIGRAGDAAIVVDDNSVSRAHAAIIVAEEAVLHDLESKNGTFLNGARITGPQRLRNGDVIGAGVVALSFHDGGGDDSTMTVQHA